MSLQMKLKYYPVPASHPFLLFSSLSIDYRDLSLRWDTQLMDGQVKWDPEWLAPWLWTGLAAAEQCECPHPLYACREAWAHSTWSVNRWSSCQNTDKVKLRAEYGSLCRTEWLQLPKVLLVGNISVKEGSTFIWLNKVTVLLGRRYPDICSYLFLTHLSCYILAQILQCS